MAEKIVIGEVDLNIDQATKDAQSLKQTIELLKNEMERAKEEGGETSKEYIQLESALKTTKSEYNQQIKIIGKSVQADTAKKGSMEQLKAQLAVVSKEWNELSEDQRRNTVQGQQLTAQKKELTEQLTKEEKATGDSRRQVGAYEKAMGGANEAVTTFIPGASGAAGAAKSLGTALKVMLGPIGLVAAAIAALISYFKRSEEGQNSLMKITKVFKTVLNNFLDVVSGVGETLFNAFKKPRETLDNLKNRVKQIGDFFQNTFGNIIGGAIEKMVAGTLKSFANIGLAWQKLKGLFTDNADGINEAQEKIEGYNKRIEDANERVSKGAEALKKSMVDGYNRAKDAIKGFVDEQKTEIQTAQNLADRQAALVKLRRQSQVQIAKNKSAIQELVLASRDETKSAEERREAILKANEIQAEQLRLKERIAAENLALIKAENALSESTIEDKEKEAQAEAELFNLRAENSAKLRELKNRELTLDKEILKEQQEETQETIAMLEMEVEAWRNSREAKRLIDEEYYERDFEKQEEILQRKKDAGLLSEQEYQFALQELRIEFEELERERQLEVEAVNFENDMERFQNNQFRVLELEKQKLEKQKAMEIAYAKRIGADVNKVEQKYTQAAIELKRAEMNAKLAIAGGFAANIATIAGEQTAIGKAAAVASTTIATIQGAVSSYNSLAAIPVVGPALGAVAAAAALVSGYAQVKEILKVKSGLPGDSGVSASVPAPSNTFSGGGGQAQKTQTTSSSVGQGIVSRDVDNQTSNSINEGVSRALQDNPLQPTLVTDDVSVNQNENLERNRTSTI